VKNWKLRVALSFYYKINPLLKVLIRFILIMKKRISGMAGVDFC
jgi:hypothetical protein